MPSFPYPTAIVQEYLTHFPLLRHSRDVIKMGPFLLWDKGPGKGCPVLDRLFRKTGLRVFTAIGKE
jgi:hypothetical protein